MQTALPDKSRVLEALRAALRANLEAMVRSAAASREGATHDENRQEGDKDMRSTEASYVARGKAMRAEEQAEALGRLAAFRPPAFGPQSAVALGTLVRIRAEDTDGERVFFIAAQGGGMKLSVDGVAVTVVTPSSPVGRALLGRRRGDDLSLVVRGEAQDYVVDAVG